jgi:hypothetical protein
MARTHSPSEEILQRVVNEAIVVHTKPAGFRKTGLNFHRRRGETIQVINVQGSQSSSWEEKQFYINVGIAFDAICELAGIAILDKVKEYECDERGIRHRLGRLVADVPDRWSTNCDPMDLIQKLSASIAEVVSDLDRIHSIAAFRDHRWFDLARPSETRCQVFYLLGDLDRAWNEVVELTKRSAQSPEWYVGPLSLVKLRPYLDREIGTMK